MVHLPKLKIGRHSPKYPIIQGGMGVKISSSGLAGAVAAAGGIGTIASVGLACDHPLMTKDRNYFDVNEIAMADAVREAREKAPDGVIAVNCMVALTDYERQVASACRAGADIIISGAGLPLKLPEITKEWPDVALVPIVSSVKAADLIIRRWKKQYGRVPDGLVVETPLYAGGHLGATKIENVTDQSFSLEAVIPELVKYLKDNGIDIPVIGAGGVWDRADMDRVFELGASGVQMGTRFACTKEGDADDRFKQAFIDAKEEDVVVIMSPVGIPGRALRNPFVETYLAGTQTSKPCMAACLSHCSYIKDRSTFCIAAALVDAYKGDWENGLFFCGSNVTRCTRIETVEEIFHELVG